MADEFGVNRETICQILVEDLGKRKVASRFVPHSLSDDQRHERVQYAKDIIKTARKGKAIPLQAWTGPESSRRLRLTDFMTIGT